MLKNPSSNVSLTLVIVAFPRTIRTVPFDADVAVMEMRSRAMRVTQSGGGCVCGCDIFSVGFFFIVWYVRKKRAFFFSREKDVKSEKMRVRVRVRENQWIFIFVKYTWI